MPSWGVLETVTVLGVLCIPALVISLSLYVGAAMLIGRWLKRSGCGTVDPNDDGRWRQ